MCRTTENKPKVYRSTSRVCGANNNKSIRKPTGAVPRRYVHSSKARGKGGKDITGTLTAQKRLKGRLFCPSTLTYTKCGAKSATFRPRSSEPDNRRSALPRNTKERTPSGKIPRHTVSVASCILGPSAYCGRPTEFLHDNADRRRRL